MESKKRVQMNLFTKTEIESRIHNRKQSYGYHGKKGEERSAVGFPGPPSFPAQECGGLSLEATAFTGFHRWSGAREKCGLGITAMVTEPHSVPGRLGQRFPGFAPGKETSSLLCAPVHCVLFPWSTLTR